MRLFTFKIRQITRYNSKTSIVASVVNLVPSQVYHTELISVKFTAVDNSRSIAHRLTR